MHPIIKHPLPHFDERPLNIAIDTVVVHAMWAPETEKPFAPKNCIERLNAHKVAAHYIIGRSGALFELVEPRNRAWHAGASVLPFSDDSRENVNHFSIGIELIGSETSGFSRAQYRALADLIKHLESAFPIKNIVGHDVIAPGRKRDPGPFFSWKVLQMHLSKNQFRYS